MIIENKERVYLYYIWKREIMRSQKALISTVVAFILQLVNIISALIIPKLIINTFGSATNGLISSITQFLGYISLLQLGVGGVTRAALYKPLADSDTEQISKVIKATEIFFRKIGIVSGIYIGVLAIIFPYIVNNSFSPQYIAFMVVIVGASTFVQYFFGFPYRLLILADQRAYVYDITQIIAVCLNVIVTVFLIKFGFSIHIVKLGSAVVFVIQPIALNLFVSSKYNINKKVLPDNVAIKQRWAGMGYSLADFIHRKTDIFILSIFSSLQEVSVYSVYSVVTNGLNSIITMATNSFQAALGDMIAKEEHENLKRTMDLYIFIVHIVSTTIFTVAIIMILPFIHVYTKGIQDVDYIRPLFAIIILLAEMIYCLRQPYQSLVIAAGKFRETQKGAIMEALINIIISLILVNYLGVLGVAIGTFVAMIYRTIDLVKYLSTNLINYDKNCFIKRFLISFLSVIIFYSAFHLVEIKVSNYIEWGMFAFAVTSTVLFFNCLINLVFYREEFEKICQKLNGILSMVRNR